MSDELTLEQIKELMAAMKEYGIGKFSFCTDDFEISLEGKAPDTIISAEPTSSSRVVTLNMGTAESETNNSLPDYQGQVVVSPIVGTFYAAPSPDKAPYVSVGTTVAKGDTLFIIESMKLMNEVTSDYAGTVSKLLVEDGQTVEYGQPIIVIE